MREKEYECNDCGAIFELVHEETEEPSFCPFCCASLDEAEQLDSRDIWEDSSEEEYE